MNLRFAFVLVIVTLFAIALASARNDKPVKKSSKTNLSCCAQKPETKNQDIGDKLGKKEDCTKDSDRGEKVEGKGDKDSETMGCCTEHAKTKHPDTKGTK